MDLVFISFVKFLGLFLCTKAKHHHTKPALEGVDLIRPKIYGFYHL